MTAWNDTTWISQGEVVVYTRRPPGHKCNGLTRGGSTGWLLGGAFGLVIEGPSGGYPRHRCPDHDLGPEECICGDIEEPGWVSARPNSAVVAWSPDDGGEPLMRLIFAADEGKDWRRLSVEGPHR